METFKSFGEFWPHYLAEHSARSTKLVHFLGTLAGMVTFLTGLYLGNYWLIPAALVVSYGPLWAAHHFIEKNRPTTLKYPVWSFMADLKMFWLLLTRQLR